MTVAGRGSRTARRLIGLAVCAVIVASCGRFERRGSEGPVYASPDAGESVPTVPVTDPPADDPSSPETSVEPLTPPPTRAPDTGRPPPVTGRTVVRTGVANRSIVDHPGWRVSLIVGDRAEYGVDETVPMQLELTNTDARTSYREVDQFDSVVIVHPDRPDERAWSHLECNPTLSVGEQPGGLVAQDPDERTISIVRYPITDECRLPAGDYLVFGQWSVCPDDARRETANPGTFVCEDGRAELVDVGPVHLALR